MTILPRVSMLFVSLACLPCTLSAQSVEWSALLPPTLVSQNIGENFAQSVARDANGNTYMAGRPSGEDNGLISKVSSSGQVQWTIRISGRIRSFDLDSNGDLYALAGSLVKFDGRTGQQLWARDVGVSAANSTKDSMQISSAGDVFVAACTDPLTPQATLRTSKWTGADGRLLWQTIVSGPCSAVYTSLAGGDHLIRARAMGQSVQVDRHTTDGVLVWKNSIGSASHYVVNLTVDAQDNVLIGTASGSSGSRLHKLNGPTGVSLWSVDGPDRAFELMVTDSSTDIIKIDQSTVPHRISKHASTDGHQLWSTSPVAPNGGTFGVNALAMRADNSVVIAGSYAVGPFLSDPLLVVLRGDSGESAWSATFDASSEVTEFATGVIVADNGDPIISGVSQLETDLDIILARFDGTTGERQWLTAEGSSIPRPYDYACASTDDTRNAAAIDENGNLFVIGCQIPPGPNNSLSALSKHDENGVLQWVATRQHTILKQLRIDAAGDVLVAGLNGRILKFSGATGGELWSATYSLPGGSANGLVTLLVDGNGDPIVSSCEFNGSDSFDFATIKLDGASGDLIWRKFFGGSLLDCPTAAGIDAANDIVVTGRESSVGHATLKYAGSDGALLWLNNENIGGGQLALSPGGDVLLASADSQLRTVRLDGKNGTLIWQNAYTPADPTNTLRSIENMQLDANEDLIVSGSNRYSGGGGRNYFIGKFSGQTGAAIWLDDRPANPVHQSPAIAALDDFAIDSDNAIHVSGFRNTPGHRSDQFWAKYRGVDGAVEWTVDRDFAGEDDRAHFIGLAPDRTLRVAGFISNQFGRNIFVAALRNGPYTIPRLFVDGFEVQDQP